MKEISPDILILLRKHAKGELDDKERGDLATLLLEHPELRDELEFTTALVRATGQLERQRLLAVIESVEVQADTPGLFHSLKKRVSEGWERLADLLLPPANYRKLAWATVVVLLLATVGLWWSNWRTDDLDEFQKTAYIPPAVPAFKGEGAFNTISIAFREYEIGNYLQSLAALSEVPKEDSLYLMVLFLRGHNYYRLGDYEQAINSFDILNSEKSRDDKYKIPNLDNANWTRILAILSEYEIKGDKSKRLELDRNIQQFLKTANRTDKYYDRAIELQSLLNEH